MTPGKRALKTPLSSINRSSALGLALLVGLSTFLGAARDAARLHIDAVIDQSWRGTYDILVRPSAGVLPLESTRGLVEGNFLGIGGDGGISISQWRQIQALPSVEVAAPIAAIGFLRSYSSAPTIEIPYPRRATLLRAEISVTTSDGVRTLRVAKESGLAFVRPPRHEGSSPELSSTFIDYSGDNSPSGSISLTVSRFPTFPSLVVAVDPASEGSLLGQNAFETMASMPGDSLLNTTTFPLRRIPSQFEISRDFISIRRKSSAGKYPGGPPRPPAPVVPLLLNVGGNPSIKISWRVWKIGGLVHLPRGNAENTPPPELFPRLYRAGLPSRLLIDRSVELKHLGLPLTPAKLLLDPRGEPRPGGGIKGTDEFNGRLALRPQYEPASAPAQLSDLPAFKVIPDGFAPPAPRTNPDFYHSYAGSGLPVYFREPQLEQTYRDLAKTQRLPNPSSNTPLDQPYYLGPLGTFNTGGLAVPYNPLNYAPLGAYDPADTELIAAPDGNLSPPRTVTPTFNSRGFIVSPPAAFTNIGAAAMLKGPTPIDAIRVRVTGLTGFNDASEARLATVMEAIRNLGLHADPIAGSSPRGIYVYVPDYLGASSDSVDLGWIRQNWTSMGAAAQVSAGLSRLTWIVVALALAAALGFAFSNQALAIRTSSREIALLRAIGWRWSHIRRLLVRSAVTVAVMIATLGLVVVLVMRGPLHRQDSIWWGPFAVAAAWMLATPLTLHRARVIRPLEGVTAGDARPVQLPRRVLSLRGYGVRQVFARPGRASIQVVAMGMGLGALVVASLLLAQAGRRAGPTTLAEFTVGSVKSLHLLILAVTAGLLFITSVANRSTDLASRRGEFDALIAMGWLSRKVRHAIYFEGSILGVMATLLASISLAMLATLLQIRGSGLWLALLILLFAGPVIGLLTSIAARRVT